MNDLDKLTKLSLGCDLLADDLQSLYNTQNPWLADSIIELSEQVNLIRNRLKRLHTIQTEIACQSMINGSSK